MVIRITRGIPKYNIQIGPIQDALAFNPSLIISVTDYFEWKLAQFPHYMWVPVNEIGKSWGYSPFFAVKRILDFHCLDLRVSSVYLGCSAGVHRSPSMGFCWLLSLEGMTPELAAQEFYGHFKQDVLEMHYKDIENGYLPSDLPEFYKLMRENPGWSYMGTLQEMLKYEKITYQSSDLVLKNV